MARIVYSCCGEGRGHSSRTLTIVRRLRALGHEVRVLASHAAYAALYPLIPDVTEIPGLVLVYHRNQVRIGRTIARNFVTWKGRRGYLPTTGAIFSTMTRSINGPYPS